MATTNKIVIPIVIFLFTSLLISFQSCESNNPIGIGVKTNVKDTGFYIGSKKCESCHNKEYADWLKSDHFRAMEPAIDSSVLGNFDSATLKVNGLDHRFFKKENKYFINAEGEDGKNHDYEVRYTFGYFPLQQYLIAFPNGKLQSTRVCWDSREKKWFIQYPKQNIHHRDWLHWTGNSQNWNTMCASCHSTNLKKNYDENTDSYQSTYDEMNVSCESCHGPGNKHLDFITSEAYKKGDSLKNSGFIYAKNQDPQIQLNACANCHARKADISAESIHSEEVMDNLIPQVINNEYYFADGQIDQEDYEYGSFSQSKMFHNKVKCSSCHNPHSGKLFKKGNDMCLSCHKPQYNTAAHTFHKGEGENASTQCVNCHMPVKTYMGNDHRRDHSFRIPRPDQSETYGTPNTCVNCHSNKTNKWASNAIVKWYGSKRAYHFSDDLLPGSLLNDQSEHHLIKLLEDQGQPEIARATAAYYLGDLQSKKSADALLNGIGDKKAMVRYQSLRALENYPEELWLQNAVVCLKDNVRAVRLAAADLYHRLPTERIPSSAKAAYQSANNENRKYLRYQSDFSVGNVMMADYELQEGDYKAAVIDYLRGLKKDSLMNYARLNLSAAYNSLGENQKALETLENAAAIDSKNERIFYNLGLLHYEMGKITPAISDFQKAVDLKSVNPSLYYNYGLLLQQIGKTKQAESVLLKGQSLNPANPKINYALSYYYLQNNNIQKARLYGRLLQKVDPTNSEYVLLYKKLNL